MTSVHKAAPTRAVGWRNVFKGRQSARPRFGREGKARKQDSTKTTMRAMKIGGIVVGGGAGRPGGARGDSPWSGLVDPNDYKDDNPFPARQQKTGRPLQIRGGSVMKLFPWIALEIREVTLGITRLWNRAILSGRVKCRKC